MIQQVGIKFCSIDHLPIDQSPAYRDLCALEGVRAAMETVYWHDTPLPKAGENNETRQEIQPALDHAPNRLFRSDSVPRNSA